MNNFDERRKMTNMRLILKSSQIMKVENQTGTDQLTGAVNYIPDRREQHLVQGLYIIYSARTLGLSIGLQVIPKFRGYAWASVREHQTVLDGPGKELSVEIMVMEISLDSVDVVGRGLWKGAI